MDDGEADSSPSAVVDDGSRQELRGKKQRLSRKRLDCLDEVRHELDVLVFIYIFSLYYLE